MFIVLQVSFYFAYSTWSKTKRIVDSDSEDDKIGKKKRRRIKKPEPDSSDEDGKMYIWFYIPATNHLNQPSMVCHYFNPRQETFLGH